MSDRRYARIYYDDLEREYPEVWRDPVLRGDYTLLLSVADRAWPASPEVPRVARPKAVRRLGELGLILLEPPYHYRCRGMDKQREERRRQAAHAANVRHAGSNADSTSKSNATAPDAFMPNQAEPSRTEPNPADPPRDPAEIYWSITGRYPATKALSWIDSLAEEYGAEPTIKAMVEAHIADRSSQTLLGRTRDRLAAEARKLDLKGRAVEKAKVAELRAQPRVEEAWRAEFRAAIERQYQEDAA
jgi:hypothetical protein